MELAIRHVGFRLRTESPDCECEPNQAEIEKQLVVHDWSQSKKHT